MKFLPRMVGMRFGNARAVPGRCLMGGRLMVGQWVARLVHWQMACQWMVNGS
jgi:hypothetical protein